MKKIINEYKEKILTQDFLIKRANARLKNIRDGITSVLDYETDEIVRDKKVANAKRQCYVQFIADLESLNN